MKKRLSNRKKIIRQKDESSPKIQWNLNRIQSQPKVNLGIMLTVLVIILTFGIITLNGQSSTASLGSTSHIIPATTFDVYRTTEGKWVRSSQTKLQALDVAVIRGKIYFFEDGVQKGKRSATAVFLGNGSKASLERLNDAYDPDKDERPSSESQIVYAKWKNSNFPTYLKIGYLKPNQTFYFQGREFRRMTMPDGGRAVKLTGNVISTITGNWTGYHKNQIHLTLHYPETGQSAKIITTHEHPFYAPLKKQWVAAEHLKVGMFLQTCDGTKVQVAVWKVVDKPFSTNNLSIANSHTFYVADPNNPNAPAVLVHNSCAPVLNRNVSRDVVNEADRIKNLPGSVVGKKFDYDGGGSVSFKGTPANNHEYQLAVEMAQKGKKITVNGKTAKGSDYLIDGVPFEVKRLDANRLSTVRRNIDRAIGQSDNIIIDGRAARLAKGTATDAIRDWMKSERFNPVKSLTIYTNQGRIRYLSGKGIIHD